MTAGNAFILAQHNNLGAIKIGAANPYILCNSDVLDIIRSITYMFRYIRINQYRVCAAENAIHLHRIPAFFKVEIAAYAINQNKVLLDYLVQVSDGPMKTAV